MTNPLALPEVISRVGKFIPIWYPRETRNLSPEFDFKPKDLLSAMNVNRTFYAALSPHLWTIYNKSALEPRLYKNPHTNNFISDELEYLFTLRNLRSLKLEGWMMSPLHLCQVLYLNAEELEELHLASPCVVQDQGPSTEATWLVQKHLDTGAAGEMQQTSGKTLSLPKIKILHLGVSWEHTTGGPIYGLVKSMPALEQLYIELDQNVDLHQLARNLQASCPHLHSIRTNGEELKNETPVDRLKIVALGGACAPEHLVDFKIGLSTLDMFTTGTLLWHKDSLANLDLTLYGQGDQGETIGGLCNLLGQCRGLRRVSVTWIGRNLDRAQGSSLLLISWACSNLEGLTLVRMEVKPIEVNNNSIGDQVEDMIKAKFANLGPGFIYTSELLRYFGWLYVSGYYSDEDWPADPVFRLKLASMLALKNPLHNLKVIQLNGETYVKPRLMFQQ
ncbi:hypothetical protein BGX24_006124 [Mortierella sp. AD032]|nr:hypothetical protein BGX24_006124 [Mortierella sp. AD032]